MMKAGLAWFVVVLGVMGQAWANLTPSHSKIATSDVQSDRQDVQEIRLDEQDLLADMDLFAGILLQAVHTHRQDDVRLLFNLYQQADNQDFVVRHYVQAYLDKSAGDYRSAITAYRRILDKYPALRDVRLLLMQAYAADKQYQNAQAQLTQLQQDAHLSDDESTRLNQDAIWLQEKSAWQTALDFNVLYDKNINQAPTVRQYQQWQFAPAMRAYGAYLGVSAQKTHTVHDNWAWHMSAEMHAKLYNRHQFDDIYATTSMGGVYQSAESAATLTPFYQKRWYGTDAYSDSVGLKTSYQKRLGDYQLELSLVGAKHKHHRRQFLDGTSWIATIGGQKNGVYLGLNHHQQNSQDKSEAYISIGATLAIQKQWSPNLHSTHRLALAHRQHQAADIFNIQRQDWRYTTEHSLWHNRLHYLGVVPSLNVRYEYIDSNHFAFDTHHVDWYFGLRRVF